MNKRLLIFLLASVTLSACALVPTPAPSMERQWESGHFVVGTRGETLVVIGIASRDINPEAEIAAARNDAAQKVAMFHRMSGRAKHGEAGHGLHFVNILERTVDYAQFVERLQFDRSLDVLTHDRGTLVRFRYPVRVTPVSPVSARDAGGRPNWIFSRGLPEITGYTVAVGFAQTSGLLRDTAIRSAQDAAMRMIISNNTEVSGMDISMGHGFLSVSRLVSEGQLDGFRILEFWIDPLYGHVHTLGIARFVR